MRPLLLLYSNSTLGIITTVRGSESSILHGASLRLSPFLDRIIYLFFLQRLSGGLERVTTDEGVRYYIAINCRRMDTG